VRPAEFGEEHSPEVLVGALTWTPLGTIVSIEGALYWRHPLLFQ